MASASLGLGSEDESSNAGQSPGTIKRKQERPPESVAAQQNSRVASPNTAIALTPEPDFHSLAQSSKGFAAQAAAKTEADELVVIDDQEKGEAKE